MNIGRISTEATVSIGRVIDCYAKLHGLLVEDLAGPSQTAAITAYRHELMFIIRRMDPTASFSLIGRFLGGRDMATVHEAIAKVEQRLVRELGYADHLAQIVHQIIQMAEAPTLSARTQAKPWQFLAACSVLRDRRMTDADARKAALDLLSQLEVAHA